MSTPNGNGTQPPVEPNTIAEMGALIANNADEGAAASTATPTEGSKPAGIIDAIKAKFLGTPKEEAKPGDEGKEDSSQMGERVAGDDAPATKTFTADEVKAEMDKLREEFTTKLTEATKPKEEAKVETPAEAKPLAFDASKFMGKDADDNFIWDEDVRGIATALEAVVKGFNEQQATIKELREGVGKADQKATVTSDQMMMERRAESIVSGYELVKAEYGEVPWEAFEKYVQSPEASRVILEDAQKSGNVPSPEAVKNGVVMAILKELADTNKQGSSGDSGKTGKRTAPPLSSGSSGRSTGPKDTIQGMAELLSSKQ